MNQKKRKKQLIINENEILSEEAYEYMLDTNDFIEDDLRGLDVQINDINDIEFDSSFDY
jgi:hypothetical protein